MRLWIKDSERRPDPEPVKTDDRTPILVGLVAWAAGLAVALIAPAALGSITAGSAIATCAIGLGLGLLGLVYLRLRTG